MERLFLLPSHYINVILYRFENTIKTKFHSLISVIEKKKKKGNHIIWLIYNFSLFYLLKCYVNFFFRSFSLF